MKWLARILVFLMAALLGTAAASIAAIYSQPIDVPELTGPVQAADHATFPSIPPTGIQVATIGSFETYLMFRIHNGLDEPVTYTAYQAERPLPHEKVNARTFPAAWSCGVGLREFTILPGTSALVRVYASEVEHLPARGETYSIGFRLRTPDGDSRVFYSNPIFVLEQFRSLKELDRHR